MEFRNDRCFMGKALYPPEFSMKVADAGKISHYVQLLNDDPLNFGQRLTFSTARLLEYLALALGQAVDALLEILSRMGSTS